MRAGPVQPVQWVMGREPCGAVVRPGALGGFWPCHFLVGVTLGWLSLETSFSFCVKLDNSSAGWREAEVAESTWSVERRAEEASTGQPCLTMNRRAPRRLREG